MARTLKCSLRCAREFQPIDRMMYARGRMLAMYLTCEGERVGGGNVPAV
jgi:hypothetical protein